MKTRLLFPLLAALAAAAPAGAADRVAAVTLHGGNATVYAGSASGLPTRTVIRDADRAVLSTDAATLAYTRPRRGVTEIRVRRLDGVDRLVARVKPFDIALSFSPDGTRLAYSSAAGIVVAPVSGSTRRVVPLPAAWRGSRFPAIAYTPDGRRLIVSRTSGDGRAGTLRNELSLVELRSGRATTLLRSPNAYDQQLRPHSFDPYGHVVALDGTGAVQLAQTGGGEPVDVTPRPRNGIDFAPLISPDGRRVAFARRGISGVSDVYVVGTDHTGLSRVTTTPIPPRGTPKVGAQPLAWSPDGTRLLVFRHDRFEVVDVATRRSTVLRRTGVRFAISSARWFGAAPVPARTGTIVFERSGDVAAGVWRVGADGSGLKRLTPSARAYDPVWSPDGRSIAYTGGHPVERQLFTMNADGSSPLQLTRFGPGLSVGSPSWFRGGVTGLRIAFTLAETGQSGGDLYAIGSDGRTTTPLTQTQEKESNASFSADGRLAFEVAGRFWIRGEDLVPRPGGLGSAPQWSPDGRRLLVVRDTGLHGGSIGVVDPDGGNFRYLAWGWTPAWSPDGSSVVYGGGDGLYVVRADGHGLPRRLTRTGRLNYDTSPSWTAFG